jgi:hypothetical protein
LEPKGDQNLPPYANRGKPLHIAPRCVRLNNSEFPRESQAPPQRAGPRSHPLDLSSAVLASFPGRIRNSLRLSHLPNWPPPWRKDAEGKSTLQAVERVSPSSAPFVLHRCLHAILLSQSVIRNRLDGKISYMYGSELPRLHSGKNVIRFVLSLNYYLN